MKSPLRNFYSACRIMALLFLFNITCSPLKSATCTWTNVAGGQWGNGNNWLNNAVPVANDNVIIPALNTTATVISQLPAIILSSLVFTGSGGCALSANGSGNTIQIRNTWTVPSGYTLTIGANGARIVWTTSTTCVSTISGYVAFDAGNTNRNFTINGTLTVNSAGCIYDPNPSGGSDFYLTNTATMRIGKAQGITTVSAANAAAINYNVAISFGGSYSYAAGAKYEYFGAAGQVTGTGLSQNTPGTVSVNLPSGDLTLTGSTTITTNFYMMSGNVNLNSNTLTLGTTGAAPGTLNYTDGMLYGGTFARWFATTALAMPSTTGLFPMGTSVNDYRPLWIGYSSALTTAGVVRVNHTGTYPSTTVSATHNDASWGNTLQGVSNSFWTVTTGTIAFSGATAMIRYGGEGFGTNFLTDLNASLLSSVVGTHGAATNANTTYEVNRTALTTAQLANAWRIGSKNSVTSPLPVTLSGLTASTEGRAVKINWITYTEKDNDHFDLQRSDDAFNFTTFKTVPGNGTTALKHNYAETDNAPFPGWNYYRLEMVSLDGMSETSEIVSCKFILNAAGLDLYPNPSEGRINISLDGSDADLFDAEVRDVFGRTVFTSIASHSVDLGHLPSGTYFVHVTAGSREFDNRLVLVH